MEVIEENSEFHVTNQSNFKIAFKYIEQAEMALEVIQHYQFNEYCIIGKDTLFSFFLTDGQIPIGEFEGEDCLGHEICDLEVKFTWLEKYTVIEPLSIGDEWLYGSTSQDTANQILQTLQYFQINYGCFVGRPYKGIMYIRQ
jgi:hypothetical protein